MSADVRLYRTALLLYPRSFRTEFADDLVQAFHDLVRDRGRGHTWRRCLVDLAVTVPRLRLEEVMNPSSASAVLTGGAVVVAAAGLATVTVGAAVGLPLLAVAAVLALTQRSRLARALTVPPSQRRHRALAAAALAAVFAGALGSWLLHITRYDHLSETSVLVHNVVGLASLAGALAYGVAAALARTPAR